MSEETHAADTLTYEPPRWVVTPAAEVGAIALRLLGVKVLVDLLSEMSQIPIYLTYAGGINASPMSPWVGIGISLAWHVALAAVLIATARPVAEAIFGRRTVAAHDLGAGAWMMLIVSGVGLAFALFSLESAVTGVLAIITRIRMNLGPAMPRAVEAAELVSLAAPILKAALGVLLFFRPSLLVTPWLRRVPN